MGATVETFSLLGLRMIYGDNHSDGYSDALAIGKTAFIIELCFGVLGPDSLPA